MKTHLPTIGAMETLERAVQLMRQHRIRHLPVANVEGTVVGIISDGDILRASAHVFDNADGGTETLRLVAGAYVRDYMSTTLKTVSIDEKVNEAIEIMLRSKVYACLVVQDSIVVGIITYDDLMELLRNYLQGPRGSDFRVTISEFISQTPLGVPSTLLSNVEFQ